jgi:hypothetical protein
MWTWRVLVLTLLGSASAASVLFGCAGPKVISTDDRAGIRTIAVRTTVFSNELQIFNRMTPRPIVPIFGIAVGVPAGIVGGVGAGAIGGALGGLADGVIMTKSAHAEITRSLGGDPDALKAAVGEIEIRQLVDDAFRTLMTTNITVVAPSDLEEQARSEAVDIRRLPRSFYQNHHIDATMDIELAYGLAVFGGDRKPTAAVAGVIVVRRTTDDRTLLKKVLSSDTYYKNGYTVEQFLANGASLYRTELEEAIRAFMRLVPAELGEDLPSEGESYWRSFVTPDSQ